MCVLATLLRDLTETVASLQRREQPVPEIPTAVETQTWSFSR